MKLFYLSDGDTFQGEWKEFGESNSFYDDPADFIKMARREHLKMIFRFEKDLSGYGSAGDYKNYEEENNTKMEVFKEWLDGKIKPELLTENFIEQGWKEAQEADEHKKSFELEARYTILGRPYSFRLS